MNFDNLEEVNEYCEHLEECRENFMSYIRARSDEIHDKKMSAIKRCDWKDFNHYQSCDDEINFLMRMAVNNLFKVKEL